MPQLQVNLAKFESIYSEPSIQRLQQAFDDHEFEHFVGYVFEQAGYVVEDTAGQRGPGLDLKLYLDTLAPVFGQNPRLPKKSAIWGTFWARPVHTYPSSYPHDVGGRDAADDPCTRLDLCTQERGCPHFMGVYPRCLARPKSVSQPAISRLDASQAAFFPRLRVIHILCG